MFAKLAALGAVFSFLGKFKAIAWLIPGVGPVLGAVAGALEFLIKGILAFIKWILVDISDAFKEPQRLIVRAICVLAAICLGAYWGIKWDAHKVEQARAEAREWKVAHKKLMDDAKVADDNNKAKLKNALEIGKAAEKFELAKPAADASAGPSSAPEPRRVRPAKREAPSGKDNSFGSWMQPFSTFPWESGSTNKK